MDATGAEGLKMKDLNAKIRKINAKLISIGKRFGMYDYVRRLRQENKTLR